MRIRLDFRIFDSQSKTRIRQETPPLLVVAKCANHDICEKDKKQQSTY